MAAITGRHWALFAERNGLDAARTVARVDELARRLSAAFRAVGRAEDVLRLGSALPARLAARVEENAERCRAASERA